MGIRDQLDYVAAAVEEVEAGSSPIGVDDRRSFLDVGVAVELEDLVSVREPCRRVLDRVGRNVDREVVAGVRAGGRRLEANRRTAEDDLDRRIALPYGHAEPSAPEVSLGGWIVGRERDLRDPHVSRIPSR